MKIKQSSVFALLLVLSAGCVSEPVKVDDSEPVKVKMDSQNETAQRMRDTVPIKNKIKGNIFRLEEATAADGGFWKIKMEDGDFLNVENIQKRVGSWIYVSLDETQNHAVYYGWINTNSPTFFYRDTVK